MSRKVTPAIDRFLAKLDLSGECHIWTAGVGNHGYGVFHPSKGFQVLAHRWAYEQFVGPIPEGLVIDHLCRERRCVNPRHMEPVTDEENKRRGAGYALLNGMRDSCRNGHRYTPENTYVDPTKGTSRCRECGRERDRQPHRNSALRRANRKAAA